MTGQEETGDNLDCWEACWAPYDEATYTAALSYIKPDDVVLDIGAGDLRLARRMAQITRRVYALEMQPDLLKGGLEGPENLLVICADARQVPWPAGITVGVLLMRHCTHLKLYVNRLRAVGCRRLITNARWRMGIELMDLKHHLDWEKVQFGRYACICGQTGFIPGPLEKFTEACLEQVLDVEYCPACQISS